LNNDLSYNFSSCCDTDSTVGHSQCIPEHRRKESLERIFAPIDQTSQRHSMTATAIEHKDKLGHILAVDDYVAYPSFNELQFGRVAKLNKIMVGVVPIGRRNVTKNTNKYPADIIRLDSAEMTWYVLRNSK
jgi:hypothetical protein|tara:strand:- start:1901 stop:2293 length:393 start_codon:yes stop_codon:yes gene_type:complete